MALCYMYIYIHVYNILVLHIFFYVNNLHMIFYLSRMTLYKRIIIFYSLRSYLVMNIQS